MPCVAGDITSYSILSWTHASVGLCFRYRGLLCLFPDCLIYPVATCPDFGSRLSDPLQTGLLMVKDKKEVEGNWYSECRYNYREK